MSAAIRTKIVLQPPTGWISLEIGELWKRRELLGLLALRDLKVRYKQTALGALWAVLQPLLVMVIFDTLFGLLMGRDNKPTAAGIPYRLALLAALLPWQMFATTLTSAGNSLVNNTNLLQKVYFPRLLIPLSTSLTAVVDFLVSLLVLFAMMPFYGIHPTWRLVLLPFFVLLTLMASLAMGLWIAALNVRYRDFKYIIPFMVQIGMFVSPVVYVSDVIPEQWRDLYFLNPMAGAIAGCRWCLFSKQIISPVPVCISACMTVIGFYAAAIYFRRCEQVFADIA
ncbi:ABC transporter permease [soil metagenome]